MSKLKEITEESKLKEITEEGDNIRAFIDLKAKGSAVGGIYVVNNLHKEIEKIEGKGVHKVVGVVYDGTENLEIITKPFKELEFLEDSKLLK